MIKSLIRDVIIGAIIASVILGVILIVNTSGIKNKIEIYRYSNNYQKHIESSMDAAFLGNYTNYSKMNSSIMPIVAVHEELVKYVSDVIMYHFDIDTNAVPDTLISSFELEAEDVLKNIYYSVSNPREYKNGYLLDVTIGKSNMWVLMSHTCDEYVLQHKNFAASKDMMVTYAEWEQKNVLYANNILKGIREVKARIGKMDTVTMTVHVYGSENGGYTLDIDDWYAMVDCAVK